MGTYLSTLIRNTHVEDRRDSAIKLTNPNTNTNYQIYHSLSESSFSGVLLQSDNSTPQKTSPLTKEHAGEI